MARQALAYLHLGRFPYTDAPKPDLIFLDLNLPKKDGREVLHEIKQDEELRRIPVIVLTTSEAEKDISRATNSMQTVTSRNRQILMNTWR